MFYECAEKGHLLPYVSLRKRWDNCCQRSSMIQGGLVCQQKAESRIYLLDLKAGDELQSLTQQFKSVQFKTRYRWPASYKEPCNPLYVVTYIYLKKGKEEEGTSFASFHIESNMKEIELTFDMVALTHAVSARHCYALLTASQKG
jgi:hypothetical protein